MLSDWQNFTRLHRNWCVFVVVATLGSIVWYALEASESVRWPGGGSLPGLTFGIVAGLVMLFELALVARKSSWLRHRRWLGSAQSWMKAHLWLGLWTVPLVVLHSGFSFGGPLTSLIVLLFFLVIASGIHGWVMQNIVPRWLLADIPQETIASQLETVVRQQISEADRLVHFTARGATAGSDEGIEMQRDLEREPLVIGAARRGAPPLRVDPALHVRDIEPSPALARSYEQFVRPYLLSGRCVAGRLNTVSRQRAFFSELRARVGAPLRSTVDQLAEWCETRRQWNRQQALQTWLHNWLIVHLPLSVALVGLVVLHACFALRYH